MFNPVIFVAILIQSMISRGNRTAGAVAGYVITTGILLWGFSLYADGGQVAFFGVPLSQGVFIFLCLVWYGFDTKRLLEVNGASVQSVATPQSQSENDAALANPLVRDAWASTWKAWRAGMYTASARETAEKQSEDEFINFHVRKYGRLVATVSAQRPFELGEFLVCVSQRENFALTDRTLYLFGKENPLPNRADVIRLHDIEEYRFKAQGQGRVIVKLRSGEVIERRMSSAPKEDLMNEFCKSARAASNENRFLDSQSATPVQFPDGLPAIS